VKRVIGVLLIGSTGGLGIPAAVGLQGARGSAVAEAKPRTIVRQKPVSLIVNGSFEDGPPAPRFLNLPGGSTAVKGWVVTGEGVDLVGPRYWQSFDGTDAIDLDGSARSRTTPPYVQGGIAQTFATVAGKRYRVTFQLAGNPASGPAIKPMRVMAAGQSAEFTFDITGKTGPNMGWVLKSWTFAAKADSTTLEFRSLTASPLTGFGAAIDLVIVAAEAEAALEVTETDQSIEIRLGAEILFATGESVLQPAATATLEKVAALIGDHPDLPIVIEGHTDSVGTMASNQTLSERRAGSVRDWLTGRGAAPAARITTRGFGPSRPVGSNATAEGRQRNRRVEIRLEKRGPPPGADFPEIPANLESDLALYLEGGRTVRGLNALERMPSEADLVLWLAGNQFLAMDELIGWFQRERPITRVGLLTLPSGLLLAGIERGGLSYRDRAFPGRPDLYGSVNLAHLRQLRSAGLMTSYLSYLHNEIELMVARGNPKGIRGIADLARPDVRTSMPNPLNEGIMQLYGRAVLERHGVWGRISGGKECQACQSTPTNWFTAAHHRETPERIRDGRSDAGMVWRTETLAAQRAGAPVEGVALPDEDALRGEVSYVIGPLTTSRRRVAARRFLAFLATPAAQDVYASFGFLRATTLELEERAIPPGGPSGR